MTREDLINLTIHIVSEYYKGNIDPFLNAVTEDVIWIGPRQGQMLSGREEYRSAFTSAKTDQVFQMGTVTSYSQSMGRDALEVFLIYEVFTRFPKGNVVQHHQRIQCSWRSQYMLNEKGLNVPGWKIAMIHISNGSPKTSDSAIYASHTEDSVVDSVRMILPDNGLRITLYGTDNSMHLIAPNQILWGESCNQGKHCLVHLMGNDTFECNQRLSVFLEENEGYYLRTHSSFFVNPLYVRSCERYNVKMADGMELPIPEKKYKVVKEGLEEWFRRK